VAAQFFAWQRLVKARVEFSFLSFYRGSAVQLAKYGSVLSIFSVAMFLISGLDIVIVGHYQYKETGSYAIAAGAANFMVAVISSVFGPLIPAVSSMQSGTTPNRIGDLCIRTTLYCALLLCQLGLPLVLGSYPLLSLWVGKKYAAQSALYLEVLVLGNIVRQLAFPYILGVVATGRQHLATIAAISEACVNVMVSVWLVQKVGAVGVAAGTLVGAFVGLSVHFLVSIPRTQAAIFIVRSRFLMEGLLRPLLIITPSLLLYPLWRRLDMLPAAPAGLVVWFLSTVAIAWWVVLKPEERREAAAMVHRLL
jgi:O-antigen/teichoic acid export membrane protein